GPGRGGQLRLGTFDARLLAGPRAGLIVTDEPMPESVFTELLGRGVGRSDRIRMLIGFTPTSGNCHGVEYLWHLVDDPEKPWVGQVQMELSAENTTPRGGLVQRPWMSQERVDEFAATLPARERDMRLGRARAPLQASAYFDRWDAASMVKARSLGELSGWRLAVGVDHGSRPGAQCAYLVAVLPIGEGQCRVHVLGEYVATTQTSAEDGAGIVEMLARVGVDVRAVDLWVGDRAHESRSKAVWKTNQFLRAGIARALGIDVTRRDWVKHIPRPLAQMRTPKKYVGSHWARALVLHRLMTQGALTVEPSCPHLIHALGAWQGGSKEPEKDKLDAFGYPVLEGSWMAAA
ncbi:MAG: hypothetical protein EBR73_15650, partial [Rhodobacteraceae bacterium]|nr:hypothetical protein [Paracoccaceae bacterium]